ncbi:MAG TPA: hypothetical protein VF043_20450 [Ktedonobacteraceae bacterium]
MSSDVRRFGPPNLPDVVGTLTNGQPFIAEAGMEDDKRGDRNLAKAEAARRLIFPRQESGRGFEQDRRSFFLALQ